MRKALAATTRLMGIDHRVGGNMQTFWDELEGKSDFNNSRQTLVDAVIGGIIHERLDSTLVIFHQR